MHPPIEIETPATNDQEPQQQRKRAVHPCVWVVATVIWGIGVIWQSMFTMDRLRVQHIFDVDIMKEDYKIVDSSLIREQDLLQTSAVFLFSAGLVSNFLSGAPADVASLQALSQGLNTTANTNTNTTASAEDVWHKGMQRAASFRGLWGACMLLTLLAVIAAYLSRTALFVSWNLAKNGVEFVRSKAQQEALWRKLPAAEAHQRVKDALSDNFDEGKRQQLLKVVPFIATAITTGKLCFLASLVLWLAAILYTTVIVYRLRPDMQKYVFPGELQAMTTGGACLLAVGATVAVAAVVGAFWLWLTCWRAYSVWRPLATHREFLDNWCSGSKFADLWQTLEPKLIFDDSRNEEDRLLALRVKQSFSSSSSGGSTSLGGRLGADWPAGNSKDITPVDDHE